MLSNSSKYALRALKCLAEQAPDKYLRVEQLSELADVPGPYLSKLIKTLSEKGLVETRRGLTGGVRFPQKRSISFYDICAALEDPVTAQGCFISNGACSKNHPCEFHQRWSKVREQYMALLRKTLI